MNTKGLLDQLLKSGQTLLQNKASPHTESRSGSPVSGLAGQLGGLGKGAIAGGALSMLMGNKRLRSLGGKGLAFGGMAALGALAYRAYSDWQQQNAGATPTEAPRTIDRISGAEAETHSRAILKALIAAAKADGHVDDRERQLIEEDLGKLSDDTALRQWLDSELSKPLDPAEVASHAESPEIASEMYLVSLMMVDDQSYMERAYLDELARKLQLEPSLKQRLETQTGSV